MSAIATKRRRSGAETSSRLVASQLRSASLMEAFGIWLAVAVAGAIFLDGSLQFLATRAVIYALFALSVNILFGWSGIASFGQAAFFGIGAYAFALLSPVIPSAAIVMIVAVLAATAVAAVFSRIAVRVLGVEFAMLTLMLGQIIWLLTFRVRELRGEDGIPGISRAAPFGVNMFDENIFWWLVVSVVAVATYLLLRIARSPLGMSMNAVRDDPLRAAAAGIDVKNVRFLAFTLAGLFAGLAGTLYAQHQGLVSPSALHWSLSGEVIVMCLIGGLWRFWGPVVGAVVLTVTDWYLFDLVASPLLYIGLVLLVIVLLLPQGLLGLPSLVLSKMRRGK